MRDEVEDGDEDERGSHIPAVEELRRVRRRNGVLKGGDGGEEEMFGRQVRRMRGEEGESDGQMTGRLGLMSQRRREAAPIDERQFYGHESNGMTKRVRFSSRRADGNIRSRIESSFTESTSDPLGFRSEYQAPAYGTKFRVPYTTAASEFVYGHGCVYAALRAKRRKLYTLYLHRRSEAIHRESVGRSVRELAKTTDVKVIDVDDSFLPVLSKLSGDKPHNGCVLEASPLPRLPVISLAKVSVRDRTAPGAAFFDVVTAPQSREEEEINGNQTRIACKKTNDRREFVLFVDDILNPGNLGALIRSAYFLGVDAVALSRSCAPLTAAVIKASAGAAESIPILRVEDSVLFLRASRRAGWGIHCAVPPSLVNVKAQGWSPPDDTAADARRTDGQRQPFIKYTWTLGSRVFVTSDEFCPLARRNTILVIGGEGRSLNLSLTQSATAFAEIVPQVDIDDYGVDSLNVSVAGALLIADMLRLRGDAFPQSSIARHIASGPRDYSTNREESDPGQLR